MHNSSGASEWFLKKHTIALIMWGLFAIIWFLLFSDFSKGPTILSETIDPYVLSTKGSTLIIRDKLITVKESEQKPIFVGDKIKTLDSTATIFWPDGSITRLGEKSSIKIHEMWAKTANENIHVDFSLESGKSWSNVIKYMFGDSYFHERFNNDTALAAVRWTVFEMNLDQKYIHTVDHAVSLEDIGTHTGSTFVVAGWVFDTNTRKALTKDKIDAVWNTLNHDADIIYLNERMESLKKMILENAGWTNYMEAILQKLGLRETDSSLKALLTDNQTEWMQFENKMKKWQNSSELLDIYQQFYGFQNTKELLDIKVKLRDLIIETAPTDKKQVFLDDFARSTLYDSWNPIGTGSIEWLQKKLEEYIKQGADTNLIESLKKAASDKDLQKLNNTLEYIKDTTIETLWKRNLLEEAKKEINTENLEKINDKTTEVRNSIWDWFKNFIR